MPPKEAFQEMDRLEPTLAEEMGSFGTGDLMDFMNLTADETGIEGTIFVSTAMGSHGPRVKYFQQAGKHAKSLSISIAVEPKLLASSLPDRITRRMAPLVSEWVNSNWAALLKFWNEGELWTRAEVNAFADSLKKLPS